MARIIYDDKAIKLMSLFEKVTHAELKDCIRNDGDVIIFIVQPGHMPKAIGKGGANVRRLEQLTKQKIKIVEWNDDPLGFIKNLVAPARLKGIRQDDGIVVMEPIDLKTRGILIGRNASHLRGFERVVQRYFDIKELKVA